MSRASAHAARFWRGLAGGKIACDLCPRRCVLGAGQRGFCFVRRNEGGRMELTTFGRSTGFCVDPIEKKPLNHFFPGTPILSFGTAGCNLGCRFCQNWSISRSRDVDALADAASPEEIAAAARELDCVSVAYTYNDPVIWAEYAIETARACRALGVRSVAVTNGYITREARGEFFSHMDAANVDLKAFSAEFYHRQALSGRGGLEDVLDTLVFLRRETSTWLEITTLLIPGLNDSEREIGAACEWIVRELGADVPLHFTAFHPDYRLCDRPPTPPATLRRAREIARAAGLHHVYTGNVHDPAGQSTCCPGCGETLIARDGYEIRAYRLDERGGCTRCGAVLAGRFGVAAGTWGGRRLPVRIARAR
ncbi:MAG: AmmeMemoRadiSam system radical SAM enzyme [Planctomycetes bacterium]|nr:AmmeMemoRadiSam system radical SAM enzyme [Planctomycetota bacterium]